MVSKHCLECGVEAHPKLKHPSTLRVEASIWGVALLVGLVVGIWSAATSNTAPALNRTLQTITLSSVESVEQPAAPTVSDTRNEPSARMEFAMWAKGLLLDFLRTAWWVLLLPMGFSLWRQFKKIPVCAACGSRELAPVIVDHGDLPPAI